MLFELRDLKEGDLPGLVALINEDALVEPASLSYVEDWFNRQPEGQIRRDRVAVDNSGQIIGANRLHHESWDEEGLFTIGVTVKREQQGQGLGSRLYDDAFAAVLTLNIKKLKAFVRDDRPECVRFAQNRGFTIQQHLFGSSIDLAEFDERPFAGLIESVEAGGIHFFSLADMGDTEEARRKFHAVIAAVVPDAPGNDDDFPCFEEFNEMLNTVSWSKTAGQIMAADGDECIGVAALFFNVDANSLLNYFTGVLPAYRGRKIAQALKLLTIRYAKAVGANYIYTNNDSVNAPMLAINRKLGYKPQPGIYMLYKQL